MVGLPVLVPKRAQVHNNIYKNSNDLKLRLYHRAEFELHFVGDILLYQVVPTIGAGCCILLMYYLSDNSKIISTLWFLVGLLFFRNE